MTPLPLDIDRKDELPGVNRIRVETTLSRFPIHRLSKSGTAVIDLFPDVQWRVSHNTQYGQPGPLAYKIDTLIINRRLDCAPRPLPEVLRLGSLREICRELGQSDHDTDIVKKALHQNASAYITAKVRQTKKGREKWIEIGYTRYSVIFTGEVLPDGRAADAVYIVLNPQHRKFLNDVEVRPLDYDYLFQLSPAPQRLYELLSFPMYGALSNDRPRARLRYSEFCTFAPVTRYFDYDPVKKQMSKIHKPHREAGYISRVEFEETLDGKGNPDWEMYYTPGPRALAEFNAFNRRTVGLSSPPATTSAQIRPPAVQSTLDLQSPTSIEEELTKRGIALNKARELVGRLQPNQDILQQIEYTDSIVASAPSGKFHNPPGLYIRNIEQNITPPPTFRSVLRLRQAEQRQHDVNLQEFDYRQREIAYDDYVRASVDAAIAGMPQESVTGVLAQQRLALKKTYPNMLRTELEELAKAYLREHVKRELQPSLLTFDQFCNGGIESPKSGQ